MSSSDSEDDCYGNLAQKLQSMKNNYQDDKLDCKTLLNDSNETNTVLNTSSLSENIVTIAEDDDEDDILTKDQIDEMFLDNLIAESSRRVTRSRMKQKKSLITNNNSDLESSLEANPSTSRVARGTRSNRSSRGRRPSRGRRGINRRSCSGISNIFSPRQLLSGPIYSVGDAEEYPDNSDSQALFKQQSSGSDIDFIDLSDSVANEELSVKVYWQSSEMFKFTVRRYQKFTQIFDYFSKRANVSYDKLLFTYKDTILTAEDTPDSIDYNIVKFIDGGVINQSINVIANKSKCNNIKNGIKIKFQCQNVKKPYEIVIDKNEKLYLAMVKFAEYLEMPLDKLKFEFDGDSLSGKSTAEEMEIEGGECIDVKILS